MYRETFTASKKNYIQNWFELDYKLFAFDYGRDIIGLTSSKYFPTV